MEGKKKKKVLIGRRLIGKIIRTEKSHQKKREEGGASSN